LWGKKSKIVNVITAVFHEAVLSVKRFVVKLNKTKSDADNENQK